MGLGSNLGKRKLNILKALSELKANPRIKIEKVSDLFRTKPVGGPSQGMFLNAVCRIKTDMPPENLLTFIKSLEKKIGRKPTVRWGPRKIDIDILLYGKIIHKSRRLCIPHPLMHERDFVLLPLVEIAPNCIHPILKKSAKILLTQILPRLST